MSQQPEMSDHPDVDQPAPNTPQDDIPEEQDDVGEGTDPTDPLKRPGNQPGADPVTSPIPPE